MVGWASRQPTGLIRTRFVKEIRASQFLCGSIPADLAVRFEDDHAMACSREIGRADEGIMAATCDHKIIRPVGRRRRLSIERPRRGRRQRSTTCCRTGLQKTATCQIVKPISHLNLPYTVRCQNSSAIFSISLYVVKGSRTSGSVI